ncbi:unnamed protein product [Rhizoctonia solani]|uniref:DUF6535 domain-containing protein n=1 Tax=Rhizoctonia solani TaxID=456999 RepID=A0A8H2ZWR8_9AGAM|nr:unnamed protein product [Rhizoctonia solani]
MADPRTQLKETTGFFGIRRPTVTNQEPGASAPATGDVDPQVANAVNDEFDEYGAELGQDARVWKTYMKEADKFDQEQVNGWHRQVAQLIHVSLDVTLIFAALFTAICTAFVIESSKSLKEDPPERSADRMDQIVDILLVIANFSSPSQLNVTQITNPKPFSPRRIDLCVNALWFFSLILSASVSLIAMLAKEWCYLFMSGRIGDPWSQTKRRQQRWKGIRKWKMERVVMFLPSLIHLAFLSFAVGLCLYLGDLHFGMAIPAALVTLGSILVYMASTFLPLLDDTCPYSTTIYRLIRGSMKVNRESKSFEEQDKERESVAIKALAWLIRTCGEEPKSLDIALQAVAGAHENNPDHQGLLKRQGADIMIYKRLLGLNPYTKNYVRLKELYNRAYSFFHGATGAGTIYQTRGLRSKLHKLQTDIERRTFDYVSTSKFIPSTDNLEALRIGTEATSHCLQSLVGGAPRQLSEPLQNAMVLLEAHCRGNVWVHRPAMDYLIVGIAVLLSRSAAESDPQIIAGIVMRLLRMPDLTKDYLLTEKGSKVPQRPRFTEGDLGLLLTVFALCRSSYSGWDRSDAASSASRTEQAIEAIIHYAYTPTRRRLDNENVHNTMIDFGLLELLSDPVGYQLTKADFETIRKTLVTDPCKVSIHTLPEKFRLYPYAIEVVSRVLSLDNGNFELAGSSDAATAYLTVLSYTSDPSSTPEPPRGDVYAFIVECVYAQPQASESPEAYEHNTALDLLERIHSHRVDGLSMLQLMSGLADSLGNKGIVATLRELPETEAGERDPVLKLFGTGQACLLINVALESGNADREDWKGCWRSFVGDEDQRLLDRLRNESFLLARRYREMRNADEIPRHPYFSILDGLIPGEGTGQARLPQSVPS